VLSLGAERCEVFVFQDLGTNDIEDDSLGRSEKVMDVLRRAVGDAGRVGMWRCSC
jgi:hypothetical protein